MNIPDHSPSLNRHPLSGFTLVEVLTVVAIVGVLVAILIPVLGQVRDDAKSGADLSNLRQIAAASRMYNNDNNGYLVPIATGLNTGANAMTWRALLSPYLGPIELNTVYASPGVTIPQTVSAGNQAKGLQPADYAINHTPDLNEYLGTIMVSKKLIAVKNPSNCIEFCDVGLPDSTAGSPYQWTQNKRAAAANNYGYAGFPSASGGNWGDWTIFPYFAGGHKVNVSFYDGHVASEDIVLNIGNHRPGDPLCLYDNH